jgi:hypothetical protein
MHRFRVYQIIRERVKGVKVQTVGWVPHPATFHGSLFLSCLARIFADINRLNYNLQLFI